MTTSPPTTTTRRSPKRSKLKGALTLKKRDQDEIIRLADQSVAEFIRGVPERVKNLLNNSMLSLLGISQRFDRYEVDHCNGRKSTLTDIVEQTVHSEIQALVGPIAKEALTALAKDKQFIKAVANESVEKFRYALRRQLEEKAGKWAETQAAAVFANLEKCELDHVWPSLKADPNDPNAFPGEVGEVLLERIAKRLVKSQ